MRGRDVFGYDPSVDFSPDPPLRQWICRQCGHTLSITSMIRCFPCSNCGGSFDRETDAEYRERMDVEADERANAESLEQERRRRP